MKRIEFVNVIWLTGYFLIMITIVLGMFRLREYVPIWLGSEESRAEWQQWRDTIRDQEEARAQNPTGDAPPAKRKVPKTDVSPIVILMEDYFIALLVAALVSGTGLFALLVFMVKAVFSPVKDRSPQPNATGADKT